MAVYRADERRQRPVQHRFCARQFKNERGKILSGIGSNGIFGDGFGRRAGTAFKLQGNISDPAECGQSADLFSVLKDNAGLVKQFAFINVERYQEVAIGSTINEAYSQYLEMSADDAQISVDTEDLRTLEAVVTSISTAVIEGNTHYYIQVENSDHIFTASIQNDNILAVIKAGDTISIKYIDSDSQFIELNEIELVNQA